MFGTIDDRGRWIDITVPASEVQEILRKVKEDGRFAADSRIWRDDRGCHIRIICGTRNEVECFQFCTNDLGLIDRAP